MADPKKPEAKREPSRLITDPKALQEAIDKQLPIHGHFIVGPERHYRAGRLYLEGEVVLIVDQKPSRTFRPYVRSSGSAAPVVAPVEGAVDLHLKE